MATFLWFKLNCHVSLLSGATLYVGVLSAGNTAWLHVTWKSQKSNLTLTGTAMWSQSQSLSFMSL